MAADRRVRVPLGGDRGDVTVEGPEVEEPVAVEVLDAVGCDLETFVAVDAAGRCFATRGHSRTLRPVPREEALREFDFTAAGAEDLLRRVRDARARAERLSRPPAGGAAGGGDRGLG